MVVDSSYSSSAPRRPLALRTLQFNVWLDAARVKDGLSLAARTILDSEADIVSLVEVKNLRGDFVERLKKELSAQERAEGGATFYGSFPGNPFKFGLDADVAVLSRYPVTEQKVVYRTRENCIVRSVIDIDGNPLAVYSVHLEYRSYSCYLPRGYNSDSDEFSGWGPIGPSRWFGGKVRKMLRGGARSDGPRPVTDAEVIRRDNIASKRPDAMARLIEDARSFEERNIPVVVMGDFNEPSALDWTEATCHLADHNGVAYEWDTTELLRGNGFVDSYRRLYPDPVTHPGYTWPAAARGNGEKRKTTDWIKMADERDRLDYIFYKGAGQLEPVDAWIVGTPMTVVKGDFVDESELFQDKFSYDIGSAWPSDHRAVLTVFEFLN